MSLDFFDSFLRDKLSELVKEKRINSSSPYGNGYNAAIADVISLLPSYKQEYNNTFSQASSTLIGLGTNDFPSISARFCVMITTYNRVEPFYQLTKRLKELNPNCRIVAVDDCSEIKPDVKYVDVFHRNSKNQGKQGWYKTVNKLWSMALDENADYYVMIPDDSFPKDNFFHKALETWGSISDTDKIALHVSNNNRESNWTGFTREDYNNLVYKTQTTEMDFMCLPEFITLKLKGMNPKKWEENPNLGSGVGQELNRHWVKQGKTIYGVKNGLLIRSGLVNDDESVMNVEERKKNPWILIDSNRKVVGMATVPDRINSLERIILSLYNQVDIIELSLNGFSAVPDFLKNYPKVYPTIRSNEMGDANKFANIEKYSNDYYFSCDDDIIYPSDYISRYIYEITKRQCLITIHGCRINKLLLSYYADRESISKCTRKSKECLVHVPGSGVSGFHTSFLKVKYSDFTKANMADIFLGILCEQQNVDRVALAHNGQWIRTHLDPGVFTIFDAYSKLDGIQTNLANSIQWSKLN